MLHQLVLTFDSPHHIGVGPIPIHLLLEFYVDTFGVFAVFLPEDLGSSPLQFQLLLEVVDLLLQTHVFLVELLAVFVDFISGVAEVTLLTVVVAQFGIDFALLSAGRPPVQILYKFHLAGMFDRLPRGRPLPINTGFGT